MNKIKNENYFQVSGWMLNDLGLSGNELIVYAIIYGFTQDGINKFHGSLSYISEFAGCSKRTVQNAIESLEEKKMIAKEFKNGETCKYYTVAKIATPHAKIATPTVAKIATNNNTSNNKRNIDERKQDFYEELKPFVETYGKEMLRAFYDYWTQPNHQKTKLGFEIQKTWDIEARLRTWKSRQKEEKSFGKKEENAENTKLKKPEQKDYSKVS